MIDTQRYNALFLAERLLYTPYLWGGDDPMAGFDCSGLVIEILRSVGRLPRTGDWTADDLSRMFPHSEPLVGSLLFWNRGERIGHVEIVWRTEPLVLTIGASGGGSSTTTLDAAIKQNAYIKIRPAVPGWVKCVDPFHAN